ncbi:MAG: hypothetical protein RBR94_00595 [Bacilli bacterium]|jgi:cell division protein FtsA|nr:hypothetical protein [Bacilli bacterium]
MNTKTAIIEITSSEIKVLVGYFLNKQPIVVYTLRKPINAIVERGKIINLPLLVQELKSLKELKDATAKIKLEIEEAIVILPALGLEVYEKEKTTEVTSQSDIIEQLDVSNAVNLIRKEGIAKEQTIVDIIPNYFELDNKKRYLQRPIGEKSISLSLSARIHVLPYAVYEPYKKAFLDAEIKVVRYFIAPHAASYFYTFNKLTPPSYLLVDLGSQLTSISLIGNEMLYSSTFFNKGGEDLTNIIANELNIPFEEAEKIKRRYDYDHRELTFYPTIAKSVVDETEKEYTTNHLNVIVKRFLDDYIVSLKQAINTLMADHDEKYLKLPLVLTGGFTRLNYLQNILEESFPDNDIYIYVPKTIGARHQTFINALGGLIASQYYVAYIEEDRPLVASLSRSSRGK